MNDIKDQPNLQPLFDYLHGRAASFTCTTSAASSRAENTRNYRSCLSSISTLRMAELVLLGGLVPRQRTPMGKLIPDGQGLGVLGAEDPFIGRQ